MTRYAALLRGINVGGNKKVSMADLRELASRLGLQNPKTLLQSGNLVFEDKGRPPARLETILEAEVNKTLNVETRFFVRSADEFENAVGANPFRAEAVADPGRLIALFCKDSPTAASVKALEAAIVGRERVRGAGRVVYAVYPDGSGTSKLTVPLIERMIGMSCTGRNWNTVLKIQQALAS